MDKNMSKRNKFLKSIAVVGATSIMAISGTAMAAHESDLSRYDANTNRYIDYIKGFENEKFKSMMELDEKINRYEELSKKFLKNEQEKTEIEEIEKYLKDEMSSGSLADFYLNDLFKEKLKDAYNRDRSNEERIEKVITRYDVDGITIRMFDKNDKVTDMDKKDKVTPITKAISDIAMLQSYEGNEDFSKSEIENFIKIQKNMKGFSNLKFIKAEGQPLAYAQIDLDKELEQE